MSRLPPPPQGTVICYSYLWAHEHRAGLEEGRKHRPWDSPLEAARTSYLRPH